MDKLRFNGVKVVVYGEVAGSVQGQIDTPVSQRPRFAERCAVAGLRAAARTPSART